MPSRLCTLLAVLALVVAACHPFQDADDYVYPELDRDTRGDTSDAVDPDLPDPPTLPPPTDTRDDLDVADTAPPDTDAGEPDTDTVEPDADVTVDVDVDVDLVVCPDDLTPCEGVCVDLETDPEHCGACGGACSAAQTCFKGSCVSSVWSGPIASGYNHTCAGLGTGGSTHGVGCWGENADGQLGSNDMMATPRQVDLSMVVASSVGIAELGTGAQHSCARLSDLSVWCWGQDARGQITGSDTGSQTVLAPTRVVLANGIESFTTLSTGAHHNCATDTNGLMRCWGASELTELVASDVTNAGANTRQASGAQFVCAIFAPDRYVRCWGTLYDSPNDGAVSGTTYSRTGIVGLAAGAERVCTWDDALRVECWGSNPDGVIDPMSGGALASPTLLQAYSSINQGVSEIFDIGISESAICIHDSLGVWCTGLLPGVVDGTPARLPFDGVAELAVGSNHLCVRHKATGTQRTTVTCAGANYAAQADPTQPGVTVPLPGVDIDAPQSTMP